KLASPILKNDELDKLRQLGKPEAQARETEDLACASGFRSITLPILYPVADGSQGLERAMTQLCGRVSEAGAQGVDFLILSDRGVDGDLAPIPALLAVAGVHHHLIREGTRTQVGLVLESGEPREVHHFALLIGYGAGAINPYLAFETLDDLTRQGALKTT